MSSSPAAPRTRRSLSRRSLTNTDGVSTSATESVAATLVGHLLECAGQITGGYFARSGLKDVADSHDLGFPIAEVPERGPIVITKVPGTGRRGDAGDVQGAAALRDPRSGCIHDARYGRGFQSGANRSLGPDRVAGRRRHRRARPDTLKVSLGLSRRLYRRRTDSYAGNWR